jgi:hypothetical protein
MRPALASRSAATAATFIWALFAPRHASADRFDVMLEVEPGSGPGLAYTGAPLVLLIALALALLALGLGLVYASRDPAAPVVG